MWLGTQVLLTPLSVLKYGMPFYTQKGGLFPRTVLEKGTNEQREFCSMTKKAKEMGEAPLATLIDELMPVSSRKLQEMSDRMRGGAGAPSDATFRDLLMDKTVWTDAQPDESLCKANTDILKLLVGWRCRNFKNSESAEAKACLQHKKAVRYIAALKKDYGRFLLNETMNAEMICPWYDWSWKAKFWWRPKFWKFLNYFSIF